MSSGSANHLEEHFILILKLSGNRKNSDAPSSSEGEGDEGF